MLGSLFELLFILLNPVSLIAWMAIIIAFNIPWEYLGLFVCGVIVVREIFSFPFNKPYVDPGHFDFLGEIMTNSANWILFIGIVTTILIRFLKRRNRLKKSTSLKLLHIATLVAYGTLAAYYFYLFCSDLLEGYQPAWEAYLILFLGILLITSCTLLFNKYNKNTKFIWLNNFYFFNYSFCLTIVFLIIGSLAFSIIAFKQTKKIISNYKNENIQYCIQKNSRGIDSWLEITPLTTWNKPNGNQGASTRHVVLVTKTANSQSIYHWSYKLGAWQYNSSEFEPYGTYVPSSLDCVLENKYSENLPFIFSEAKIFNLKQKKFRIPTQYFPQEYQSQNNKTKTISFQARLPNFTKTRQIFYKLFKQIIPIITVSINCQDNEKDLENVLFTPYSELKVQKLESEYGLQRRSIPQVRYKDKYKNGVLHVIQEMEQNIQYYERKRGVLTTLINCSPHSANKLNCQHYFIDQNMQYSFIHSDRELKNWRKLQKRLINKVKSWELE